MTPHLEIGGDYRLVIPGVYLVELPLPFSLGSINVYLVRLNTGYLLIDCGMDTDACMDALRRAKERLGIEWNEIRQILVTHVHPDHVGLARKLRDLTGARMLMHGEDVKQLAQAAGARARLDWQDRVLVTAGVPADVISRIDESLAEIRKTFHAIQPDVVLDGGETIPAEAGVLEVIWTRGHSPGHVCLYGKEKRLLFAGDQILEHITPNVGWQPDHDALGEFLTSLDRLSELDVDLILPSHGAPFTGHREWIRNTVEHHVQRCEQIKTSLARGPKTAYELVADLWNRTLSPFHQRFAIFEVMAHLEYLKRRGELAAERDRDVDHWFSPTPQTALRA